MVLARCACCVSQAAKNATNCRNRKVPGVQHWEFETRSFEQFVAPYEEQAHGDRLHLHRAPVGLA